MIALSRVVPTWCGYLLFRCGNALQRLPSSMPESLWTVYIIRCGDGSLYTGIATDVERRFAEHVSQGPKTAKYLRGRLPLELVYRREIGTRSEASKEELRIKRLGTKGKMALVDT